MDMRPPPPATQTQGHLLIDDVVKVYDPEGAAVLAVDHCTLEIEPGEICMIVGPSGCGKTTLLNAIAGFHDITSGAIYLDGEMLCGPRVLAIRLVDIGHAGWFGSFPGALISGIGPELPLLRLSASGVEHWRSRLVGKQLGRLLEVLQQSRVHGP